MRVWDYDGNAVYVTLDSLESDTKNATISIRFPLEDVFKYDPRIVVCMDRNKEWDWES